MAQRFGVWRWPKAGKPAADHRAPVGVTGVNALVEGRIRAHCNDERQPRPQVVADKDGKLAIGQMDVDV
jgi:hypothetical protein